jgi:DNA-binding NtrC family response regulator
MLARLLKNSRCGSSFNFTELVGSTAPRQKAWETMSALKRILVVDDEESVLFVLYNGLLRLDDGYDVEVDTARDGREALEKLRETPFDLMITDLRFPGMDGIELTEAARELDPDIAVIWVTAYDCHKTSRDAERLGVYRCLDKPLEIDEIRSIAREALDTTVDRN